MNSPVETDRRQWLRIAALGGLGSGLVAATAGGQPPEGDKEKEARERFLAGRGCPQVLKVSKRLTGPFHLFPGEPCKCECKIGDKVQTVFQANYRAILKFQTARPCDETEQEPLLQGGTELWLDGRLTLRLERCREADSLVLLGCNQGTYTIHRYRPNTDVMRGPFCGTEGFLPTEREGRRCCAPGHGMGSFCGEGFNNLKGWSLCVSYHSLLRGLTPESMCKESKLEMVMDLDGALIGPCEPIE